MYQNPLRVAWHRRHRVPRPSMQQRQIQHIITAWTNQRRDPPAPKYCFLAKCTIHSAHEEEGGAVGVIFAFDKRPDVGAQVDDVAKQFATDTGMWVSESDLTVFAECPQEISDRVFVQLFESPCSDDDVLRIIRATMDDDDSGNGGDNDGPEPGPRGPSNGPQGPSNGPQGPPSNGPRGPPSNGPQGSNGGDGPGGVIRTSIPKPKGPTGHELALP